VAQATIIDRSLSIAKVDFSPRHRQPSLIRVALASVLSIGGSLLADALLVAAGTAAFPSTNGYVHFQFHDYARLTIVGVLIACVAWPIVTRITSSPRWLFLRLAILVTLLLLVPDLWLLARHQSPKAVGVLVAMHLAIALVTYNALVRVARIRRDRSRGAVRSVN